MRLVRGHQPVAAFSATCYKWHSPFHGNACKPTPAVVPSAGVLHVRARKKQEAATPPAMPPPSPTHTPTLQAPHTALASPAAPPRVYGSGFQGFTLQKSTALASPATSTLIILRSRVNSSTPLRAKRSWEGSGGRGVGRGRAGGEGTVCVCAACVQCARVRVCVRMCVCARAPKAAAAAAERRGGGGGGSRPRPRGGGARGGGAGRPYHAPNHPRRKPRTYAGHAHTCTKHTLAL